MYARNLTSYLREKDWLGVEVGSWAVSDIPGFAKCRYCSSIHNFRKSVAPLLLHSISKKHRDIVPSKNSAQLTSEESLSKAYIAGPLKLKRIKSQTIYSGFDENQRSSYMWKENVSQ